jgi:hypothetical protein
LSRISCHITVSHSARGDSLVVVILTYARAAGTLIPSYGRPNLKESPRVIHWGAAPQTEASRKGNEGPDAVTTDYCVALDPSGGPPGTDLSTYSQEGESRLCEIARYSGVRCRKAESEPS